MRGREGENASSFKIFRVSRGQMENRKSEREIEQGRNRSRVLQKYILKKIKYYNMDEKSTFIF